MAKKRKVKAEPVLVTIQQTDAAAAATVVASDGRDGDGDDDGDTKADPVAPPLQAVGKGATPAANQLASTQLDSDDEDVIKRKKDLNKQNAHVSDKHTAAIRRERKRLYELQESKRRMRQEEGRSKSNNDDGETPLKQKVKRLRTERKAITDEYANYKGGSMKKNKNKQQQQQQKKKKRSHGIPLPNP